MNVLLAYMYVYMGTMCMPAAFGGQKRMSDTLELELQTVMSQQMLGMEPASLGRKEEKKRAIIQII